MVRNRRICLRASLVWFSLAVAAALPFMARGQDSLDTLRENVREGPANDGDDTSAPPTSSAPRDSQPHSLSGGSGGGYRNPACDCDDDDSGLFMLAALGVTSPFWGPYALLEGGEGRGMLFPSFPYDCEPGYMQDQVEIGDGWLRLRKSRNWAGRFSFESGHALTSDQNWLGGRGLIETNTLRLGIDLDVRHWQQVDGLTAGDQLWLGKSDLTFRFAQSEHWLFRTGLGMNWLSDDAATDLGFNFTYGIDWFPVKPLVFSSEIDLGTLGEAWLFHARTSAGILIKSTEVFIGYDYYDIGDAQFTGLGAGVRVWF